MIVWSLLGSVIGSEVRIQEPHQFLATIPGVRSLAGTGVQFADLGRILPGEDRVFIQQRIVIPTGGSCATAAGPARAGLPDRRRV